MRKLYSYYYKSSVLKIILIGIPLLFILSLFVTIIFELLNIREIKLFSISGYPLSLNNMTSSRIVNNLLIFLLVVVLGPLAETIIFQYLPLKACQKWFSKHKYSICITIVFASIVFALIHLPRVRNICSAFLSGLIYCFVCFVFMRKKRRPILYTTILHGCYNFIAITVNSIPLLF